MPLGDDFAPAPQRVRAVFVVSNWNRPGVQIERMSGPAKVQKLLSQRAGRFCPGRTAVFFQALVQFVAPVPVAVVQRPAEGVNFAALTAAIEEALAS